MTFNLTELSTERFNRVTALLEYLDLAPITCSWFSQYNSVVFDPISSQPLKVILL